MSLETATYISDLNASNPVSTDDVAQGDDHIRLIKSTVKATFPSITGATAVTQAALDAIQTAYTAGKTQVQTGQIGLFLKAGTPAGGWLPLTGLTYNYNDYPLLGAYMGATAGGTFTLPNVEDTGRYLRSKSATLTVGTTQANQQPSHTHTFAGSISGTSSTESAGHTHAYSGTTGGQSADHTHTFTRGTSGGGGGLPAPDGVGTTSPTTSGTSNDHTHAYSGSTNGANVAHTHDFSASYGGTTGTAGTGTEVRPETLVVAMWVKT